MPSNRTPPHLFTLIALTAIATLSLNMFLPSLANMASDFQVDYALISLSIGGYLAISAVLQIIVGPLSDRYGRRPVLLVALGLFTLASLGCILSANPWVFLAFRMLQGAIIAGAALSRAVIRDMVPANEAASLLGYVGMVMAIAPMLGPMFGGVLDMLFGWRSTFIVFTALGAGLLVLCWIDLGETHTTPSDTFAAQFQAYPALLRDPGFWSYALCMAFSVGAFYAFLAGAPLVSQTVFDMSPGWLGFYMGSISGGFFFGSFLSGRIARRYALSTLMLAGRIVACTGLTIGILLFAGGLVHELTLFGATICVGVGNGLTTPASNAGTMSVRPDLAGSASGLSGALTVASGAVLSTITGLVVTETNPALSLLGLMLAASALGLVTAIWARRVERRIAIT